MLKTGCYWMHMISQQNIVYSCCLSHSTTMFVHITPLVMMRLKLTFRKKKKRVGTNHLEREGSFKINFVKLDKPSVYHI